MRLNGFSKWVRKIEGFPPEKKPLFEYDKTYAEHEYSLFERNIRYILSVILNKETVDIIDVCFSWDNTPNGFDYWESIVYEGLGMYLSDTHNCNEVKLKLKGILVSCLGEDEAKRRLYL